MYKQMDKVTELMKLSIAVSVKTKADAFVRYAGHVDLLEVDILPNGWKEDFTEDEREHYEMWHTDTYESICKNLDSIINRLNALLETEEQE